MLWLVVPSFEARYLRNYETYRPARHLPSSPGQGLLGGPGHNCITVYFFSKYVILIEFQIINPLSVRQIFRFQLTFWRKESNMRRTGVKSVLLTAKQVSYQWGRRAVPWRRRRCCRRWRWSGPSWSDSGQGTSPEWPPDLACTAGTGLGSRECSRCTRCGSQCWPGGCGTRRRRRADPRGRTSMAFSFGTGPFFTEESSTPEKERVGNFVRSKMDICFRS